ncbi:hypothetical protein Pelo_10505 [Pelomyxa schiedti]|nr:hypothetical protein Pelo_10505 [Pelomyxa schiedti]
MMQLSVSVVGDQYADPLRLAARTPIATLSLKEPPSAQQSSPGDRPQVEVIACGCDGGVQDLLVAADAKSNTSPALPDSTVGVNLPTSDVPSAPQPGTVATKVKIVRDAVTQHPVLKILPNGTDLKVTPPWWLAYDERLGVDIWPYLCSSGGFQANPFRIFEEFPSSSLTDFGDAVDIIAPTQNLKSVFKMPFGTSESVSLAIHRIGQSLVIDGSIPLGPAKKKNPENTYQNTLFSKFLYHSLETRSNTTSTTKTSGESQQFIKEKDEFMKVLYSKNPPPELSDPPKSFTRLYRFTLCDKEIIHGSDLPLFCTSDHALVSLCLRDLDRVGLPDSSTWLDLWLENVLCNASAVAICYHKEGVVQGYQVVPTEELPKFIQCDPSLNFKPEVAMNQALSLIKFLHSTCTKFAGTYWLFKPSGESSVNVYDISNFCELFASLECTPERPFSHAVAMLCYRTGYRVFQADLPDSPARSRDLFQGTIQLVDKERYPTIWADAHERIADTHLYQLASPFLPPLPSTFQSATLPSEKNLSVVTVGTSITRLSESDRTHCEAAKHLVQGIDTMMSAALKIEPRNRRFHSLKLRSMAIKLVACLYYLANSLKSKGHLGGALRLLELSGIASVTATSIPSGHANTQPSRYEVVLFGSLLALAGDIYISIPSSLTPASLSQHRADSHVCALEHEFSINLAAPSFPVSGGKQPSLAQMLSLIEDITLDPEANYRMAALFYMRAQNQITREVSNSEFMAITRKLGNVQNQLGLYFLNINRPTKAAWNFTLGIDTFRSINDKANIALLHCNLGHVMRLSAECERARLASTTVGSCGAPQTENGPIPPTDENSNVPFGAEEEVHYTKAIQIYKSAQDILEHGQGYTDIWNKVSSELATTFLSLGTRIMQGRPDCLQEAAELMLKALKMYTDLKLGNHMARAHFSLGRVYSAIAAQTASGNYVPRVLERQEKLAANHYKQALLFYTSESDPDEFIRITCELAKLQTSSLSDKRSKNLSLALQTLLGIQSINKEVNADSTRIALTSASFTVRDLLKEALSSNTPARSDAAATKKSKKVDTLKDMYRILLTAQQPTTATRHLQQTLASIASLWGKNSNTSNPSLESRTHDDLS